MAMKFNSDMLMKKTEVTNPTELEIKSERNFSMNTLYPKETGTIVELDINKLNPSPFNNFKPIAGEIWEEFKKSIGENGILNPIIVRVDGKGGFEVLAGHNRVRAAKEVGLTKVPAIIKDVDDLGAAFIVADTNLQREKVSDLEKGWAYRHIYEAIARQGKRNDLTYGLSDHKLDDETYGLSDHKLNVEDESAGGLSDHKLKSSEIIAEKYGVAEKTVRRKIRLTYLLPQLYEQYEKRLYVQDAIIYLSYLKPSEQSIVHGLREEGLEFTVDFAKAVKELSECSDTPIGANAIKDLYIRMNGNEELEKSKPAHQTKYKIDGSLFPSNIVKKKGREEYINKALKYIMENEILFEM